MLRRHPLLFAFVLLLGACGDDSSATDAGLVDGGRDADPLRFDGSFDGGGPRVCVDPGGTVGQSCTTSSECTDNCICNGVETCVDGMCVAGESPCDDGQECTTDSCDEDTRRCTFEPDDTVCDDGDQCNGAELCVMGLGCRPGVRPTCTDGDPCTVGSCDPEMGCVFTPRDLDGDGFADERCGGVDCLDDPEIGGDVYPGQTEVCGNGIDDNCNLQLDYREPACLGENDTCATAEALPGAGTYVRTTRGLANDVSLGCRPSGLDSVFTFTLTEAQDVTVLLDVEGGNGAVAIRPVADCAGSGPDTYCQNDSSSFTMLAARDVEPGEYALIVKTSTATSFALTLSFLDPTPVLPVDVCADDTIDISGGGTFMGLFADVGDDYELACRTPSATAERRDVAYRLEITDGPKDVELIARTRSSSSTTSTYLTLVRDCVNPDSSIACVQSRDATIFRRALEPGVYFVLIESSSSTPISWELEASIVDAMPRNEGDACSSVVDITDATSTLPLSMLELDYGTSCGGDTASSRDATFSFTLSEERDVILESNVGAIHYLAVSTECGNPATEITCTSGTPALSPRLLRVEPGTYYVTLSTNLASGDVTVSARTEEPTFPPDNDVCGDAIPLESGVDARGTFLGAGDANVHCGPDGSSDVYYLLELEEERNVTLVARRTDGITEPLSLSLFGGACDAPDAPRCATGTPALLNQTLEAGTYYVVVESLPSFSGTYALTAYLADP